MKRLLQFLLLLTVFQIIFAVVSISYCYGRSNQDSLKIIEKVYLQLDRACYYPGDDIWFKAYLINASSGLLSGFSSNLHVEIISPELEVIESRIVKIRGGLANGDFHLKDSLKSGRYRIRAYTNYMQNFGDELFFMKDILVINSSDAEKAISDSPINISKKPEIDFFPEGGSLVDNVKSIVAFKAVDANGIGCNVSGEVYSSAGDKVAEFKSINKGMGTFPLVPVSGLKYYAVIETGDSELIRYKIPESFITGVTMNVSGNKVNELNLIFKTNQGTFKNIKNHDLTLTVSARNSVFKTYSFRMKSLNSFLNLPVTDLPEGIVKLKLSGVENIPLCERIVFLRKNEDVSINILTDRSVYGKRDSVSVRISVSDSSDKQTETYLSLSAADDMFTGNASGSQSTIESWFLLESDVRGKVEEPYRYFDISNPNRYEDLDLLLLTQGWRDFEWKYKKINYPPENGFTVSGRVRKKFADVPVKNADVTIGIFKNGKPLIGMIPTDSSGRFYLKGIDMTGTGNLVASVTTENDELKGWLLLDSMMYPPAKITDRIVQRKIFQNENQEISDTQPARADLHTFIQYSEIKSLVQKKYKLSDTVTPGEVNIIARRVDAPESARARSVHYLMGQPDKEFVISPMIQKMYYNTGQFLVSSGVLAPKGTMIAKGASSLHWMRNPLFMIDGMRVMKSDVESLPVRLIERIDILNQAASYQVFGYINSVTDSGTIVFGLPDGVISVILKDDWMDENSTVYHSASIKFRGYDEPRIFYSPKHYVSLESDYKPDLRTTLFWEPNIMVDGRTECILKYFNSDNVSGIKIIVEGITSMGVPVYAATEYKVQ
jgi:hypothetical protein